MASNGQRLMGEAELQREFFTRVARDYDATHSPRDEHGLALQWLKGCIEFHDFQSLLEIGAGTGRRLQNLRDQFPHMNLLGVEPVAALREQGYAAGLPPEILTAADGYDLPFGDIEFDVVTEFAMLHHVRHPERVISEMLRVARRAIFVSDCNNFGHGSTTARRVKIALYRMGLWRLFIWARTRGKGYDVSEGDGISYSYSVFGSLGQVRRACSNGIYILNTSPLDVPLKGSLLFSASHVAVLGLRDRNSNDRYSLWSGLPTSPWHGAV